MIHLTANTLRDNGGKITVIFIQIFQKREIRFRKTLQFG